ncbi:MAG: SDR family oxidoreductase [Alphaproteobacteria bacterium]|nr:SDR family oxidoreductase [Alphaproteobacteria bacterium]
MTKSGKIMLVTGGGRGIGAATVRLAAKRGYRVAFCYRSDKHAADGLAAEVQSQGGDILAIAADVSNAQAVSGLFRQIDETWGRLDVLVNNAGMVGPRLDIEALALADVTQVLGVNFLGPLMCCQEALLRMSTRHGGQGGAIVNVGSQAAIFGGMQTAPYVASKAALHAFGLSLAREAGPQGIRVNTVSPGVIETEANADIPSTQLQQMGASIPLGRLGAPEEVAEAILWLASASASYVHGAVLPVGGGR